MYREDVVLLHQGITEFSALNHKAEFTSSSESLSYSRTPTFFYICISQIFFEAIWEIPVLILSLNFLFAVGKSSVFTVVAV